LLLTPFMATLLWPIANFILLAPQRRAHDPDANRPI
jgi:rod shape-determining protein MreD